MERKDYRLAAILYTDIAGFSKMMEKNEARTLELLHAHNALIEDVVARRGGTVIKTIGDAFLIDFKNTVDALQAAIEIQYKLYERNKENPDLPLLVRIGAHLGDINFYDNDALGEGINIAARLQAIAHPGCIVMSHDVYTLVLNKVDFAAEKLGKVSLKNITKEIQAYEIATPNVDFDPNRTARPILRPDKDEKILASAPAVPAGPSPTATASSGAASAAAGPDEAKRADVKRRIMLDIKAAGRRLSVDQMTIRYGGEGPDAVAVVQELAAKGILLRGTEGSAGAGADQDAGNRGGAGYGPEAARRGGPSPTESFKAGFAGVLRGDTEAAAGIVRAVTQLEYHLEDQIKKGLDSALTPRGGRGLHGGNEDWSRAHRERREERENMREELREARRELRRDLREEARDAAREAAEAARDEADPEDRKWDKELADSHFRTSADAAMTFDSYLAKTKSEARSAAAGFVGHLIPFVAVNSFLMWFNLTVAPGFPWALFPLFGWGIGILEHFSSVLRRKERAKEAAALPPLDAGQLSLFKKLQKKKDAFWHHLSSNASTAAFLFMINSLFLPGFPWAWILVAGMAVGLLSHAAGYAHKKGELRSQLRESLAASGSRAPAGRPAADATPRAELGPYAGLVAEAEATRAAIIEQVGAAAPAGAKGKKARRAAKSDALASSPVGDDLLPALDSYVEQVGLLARRTCEVDRIIELIPMDALAADKEGLQRKVEQAETESLKREYRKSLAEIDRQEASFKELKEQREVLELRMRSSVNTLKQMRIDLARLSGMEGKDDSASALAVKEKTAELNRYLADLRAGYEELEELGEENGTIRG